MVLRRNEHDGSALRASPEVVLSNSAAVDLVNLGGSWRRCQERYRFDRGGKPYVTALSAREIGEQREPFNGNLVTIQNELEFVHSTLQAASFCASFSDMAGIILHYQADKSADPYLEIERPGAIWAEGVAGTNGVGTCVVERRPTMVIGRDHFFREYASLSCIAAPVLSAETEMIGVLNVTTANPDVTTETFSLVANIAIRTAERLSNQLFLDRFRQNTILKIGNGDRTILLALDGDQRIVGANRGARDCFGWRGDARPERDLWSIFERDKGVIDGFASADHLKGLRRLDNHLTCDATILHRERKAPGHPAAKPPSPLPKPEKRLSVARPRAEALTIEKCLGPDPKMQAQARLLRRVAGSSLPILLLGETGVGKDTLAKVLHSQGERRDKPFVAFNCAAVPESLIDSELFGYGVGAFTGAKREGNIGRLQQADGGTLFLDEIGDMPLSLQTRLLRVLESGEISPLGSAKLEHINVDVIAATNNDVGKAVAEGRFRQDLYYRLAGVVVELQPLRERPDLVDIAHALLASEADAPPARLGDDAMAALVRHPWPGNVRELKFVLRRARHVCENGVITAQDLFLPSKLPPVSPTRTTDGAPDLDLSLQDAECKVIVKTLAVFGGDVNKAAQALNMSRATLYRKIRLHKLGSQKVIN
ncbi:sigma-54-dependent Fis family transcriptional regulator [Labrys monachus]|uniref:Transcriptional regulator of acetoin/glycerol metabolism n=1 Tax=Labrys monachus TaxID=217067 RepID=A0ABU0F6M4_9HYPH|nr:sigma-54-dependent Fis family transcriptional regulator [Labrys monachus]MDQ0390259.1 transcriptional regulator of acetoin/glycerol metabolism [Labrys monachus]